MFWIFTGSSILALWSRHLEQSKLVIPVYPHFVVSHVAALAFGTGDFDI